MDIKELQQAVDDFNYIELRDADGAATANAGMALADTVQQFINEHVLHLTRTAEIPRTDHTDEARARAARAVRFGLACEVADNTSYFGAFTR